LEAEQHLGSGQWLSISALLVGAVDGSTTLLQWQSTPLLLADNWPLTNTETDVLPTARIRVPPRLEVKMVISKPVGKSPDRSAEPAWEEEISDADQRTVAAVQTLETEDEIAADRDRWG
jgi:hypothetical protein